MHNALTDSGLLEYLHAQGITDLTISGIRSEQCCETTTRVASDLGFNVYYVTEATLTFAMTHADGTVYSADEIKNAPSWYWQGDLHEFAQWRTWMWFGCGPNRISVLRMQ